MAKFWYFIVVVAIVLAAFLYVLGMIDRKAEQVVDKLEHQQLVIRDKAKYRTWYLVACLDGIRYWLDRDDVPSSVKYNKQGQVEKCDEQ